MGTAVATAFGLISLAIGALLGAMIERSRARAGYLAKRYREHLGLLLDLARSKSMTRPSDEVEQLRKQVLNARPAIDSEAMVQMTRGARSQPSAHPSLRNTEFHAGALPSLVSRVILG